MDIATLGMLRMILPRPPTPKPASSCSSYCSYSYFQLQFQNQLGRLSTPRPRKRIRMSSSAAGSESKSKDKGVESEKGHLNNQNNESVELEVMVQYVVLRRDLIDSWPLGSVVTQGCHASVAAIWEHKDHPHTLLYCSPSNLDSMHKVTLEVKGESQLLHLSEKLKACGISHKLWIEQPENFPTCLATKPYPKSMVSSSFRKLKLCK